MTAYNRDRPPKPLERRGLIIFFFVLLVGASFATSTIAEPPMIGRASVVDGDTIEIAGERIRFNGIDAPEGRQTCDDAFSKPYGCDNVAARALDEFRRAEGHRLDEAPEPLRPRWQAVRYWRALALVLVTSPVPKCTTAGRGRLSFD